jgi:hypothetical protein
MNTLNMRPFRWSFSLALLAAFAAIVAGVGCTPVVTNVHANEVHPSKQATKADLVSAYNQLSRSITSINASVSLFPTTGSVYNGDVDLKQYHDVNAFILAAKPAMIRVIGQAPVLAKNVFDMTSDGREFHVYIPSKNKFVVGPATLERAADKPIENLRPQHILDAIFWPEIPASASVIFEEANEPAGRYYVLTVLSSVPPGETEQKIWFDRADLSLCRVQIYGAGGRLLSDVHMDSWQTASPSGTGGAAQPTYPWHIVLNRPHDDYQLEIRVKKITLNEVIPLDRFKLDQPSGTELVRIGVTGPGSQPPNQK